MQVVEVQKLLEPLLEVDYQEDQVEVEHMDLDQLLHEQMEEQEIHLP